jgi:hypothetical protein
MNLLAYKALYDFSEIEAAIQSFFVAQGVFVAPPGETAQNRESWIPDAGSIAFLISFQAMVFQAARPRVACVLNGINPLQKMIVDNNGAIRNAIWKGNLILEVITDPNYALHTDLRATVQALGEMIAPQVSDPTLKIGANQYLANHQINYIMAQNMDSSIHAEEGFYGSQLNFQITFSVPLGAFQAVVET